MSKRLQVHLLQASSRPSTSSTQRERRRSGGERADQGDQEPGSAGDTHISHTVFRWLQEKKARMFFLWRGSLGLRVTSGAQPQRPSTGHCGPGHTPPRPAEPTSTRPGHTPWPAGPSPTQTTLLPGQQGPLPTQPVSPRPSTPDPRAAPGPRARDAGSTRPSSRFPNPCRAAEH